MEIHKAIEEVRKAKGWSQMDLALECDIDIVDVEKAEKGKRLTVSRAEQLLNAMGWDLIVAQTLESKLMTQAEEGLRARK